MPTATTTKYLALADGLRLPIDDAATQTYGFIARKGAGKTYAAGKLTELLLDAGVQVVILDLVGNWYGLRLAADGKGDGFDIPVLGGLRGDIPMNAAAGELVADLVADTGRSVILDLSQFSKGERKKFATAFGERLWARKKAELDPTPLHLVIEESQLIIPQVVRGDDARMVGIFEEIVRLGRNYGIGVSLISQRPQSVNKEALTQVECLVVLQVNGTPERKALREWIVDKGLDVDLLRELPSLPVGTAYVWSPQWLGILQKVTIGRKRTYDASATPTVGRRRASRELKPLDLASLQERMASVIAKAQATDPKALQAKVRDLERQLAQRPTETVERVVEKIVEVPVVTDAQIGELRTVAERAATMGAQLLDLANTITAQLATVRPTTGVRPNVDRPGPSSEDRRRQPVARKVDTLNVSSNAGETARSVNRPAPTEGVTAPQQRILDALATFEALSLRDVDKSNVAVFADASPTSSSFTNNLGRLRSMGLVDYPVSGRVALTEAGQAQAAPTERIASLDQLHAAWYAKLPNPQVRILAELVAAYPNPIDKVDLASFAQQSPTSSSYTNNLGRLRSLGLVTKKGPIAATELLFPEGLR